MNVGHRLADGMRSVVAYWSSVPTTSQFIEKGTLTPKEFIEAGDQLTFKFPTWQWCSASSGREVSWLPSQKQFLITKNVPCKNRVRDLDKTLQTNARVDEGGWWVPCEDEEDEVVEEIDSSRNFKGNFGDLINQNANIFKEEKGGGKQSDEVKCENCDGVNLEQYTIMSVRDNYVKDDAQQEEGMDISSFQNVDNLLQQEDDPAAVDASSYFVRNAPDSDIVSTRTYDLSITYDKYYQTPRLWLFGYDENGSPLKSEQIFEDVLTEYASKTVTVDPHPSTGILTASIHPCKHSAVMKKVVNSWQRKGIEPRHDLALFVLLKFISSVIPTIDYDFTMDIDMSYMHSNSKDNNK